MSSLKQKAVSAAKWQVINNVLQKVISVGTFAVLARILEPSVFGLFAMAFIDIDGLGMFKSLGLDAGIIQRKTKTESANHTAFFLIQGMGIVLFIMCEAFAPFAGHFFNRPEVGSILKALGVIFVMSGFGRVPAALLTKDMRFRLMSIIELVGATINCFFAIIFALISPTVWSLVWAYIIKQITMTGLTWYFSDYRMKWQFDSKVAKELFHFGKFMVGLSILWYIGGNIGNAVVGKMMGATALGYYTLANNIGSFINTNFTSIVSRIMFPAYSAIQDDEEAIKRAYLKTIKFISMFSIPFAIMLICLAKELVLTLYGEKWRPVIPLLQLFGVIQMIVPITICSGSLFRGCGKPAWEFNVTFFRLLLGVPTLIIFTIAWGLFGTLTSAIVMTGVFAPVDVILDRKIVQFDMKEFFAALSPSIVCSLIMGVSIAIVKTAVLFYPFLSPVVSHHFIQLLTFGLVGVSAYLIAFFFIDRRSTLEVLGMVFKLERV